MFVYRQLVAPSAICTLISALFFKRTFVKRGMFFFVEFCNTVGTVMSVLFISITSSALLPLVCYQHPAGSGYSMTANSATLCWEGYEHQRIVMTGLLALMLIIFPFLALVLGGTYMFPTWTARRMTRRSKQLAAMRFLFFRFKADRYYYGSLYMLRNVCICMVPVLIGNDAAFQLFLMVIIL